MRVHITNSLFAWDELQDNPSLATLRQLLAALPDAQLLADLRRFRGKGRNDYPVEILWGVLVLSVALRHVTIEACLAELARNAGLRRLIGISSWHLDLTVLQVLWFRYTVAALLDGFSRKLLRLQVYRRTPTSRDMVGLVRRAGREFGMPRFLITDHGCQFRRQFKHAIEALSITHVRGRVRSASFNGKAERLFRTLRQWYRLSLLPLSLRSFQRRLDRFRAWHNSAPPHQALGVLTPEEVWVGTALVEPIPFRAADPQTVSVEVERRHHGGDPRLPVFRIEAMISRAA